MVRERHVVPPARRERGAGLYLLGLSWQHTRGSALLGFVNDDAAYLADRSPPATKLPCRPTVVYPVGLWPGLGAGMESGLE